ncbi:hypothetical protein LENED_007673 [Lentinula edodes]|uniref:Uncharacterized protein n=1 Tax=Lentinula edodes TaxID=5353 RepID=A0A1Q3EF00_LENED|nr:hypothetical protein LENED_007673 [Lentinula edodes]
MPSNPETQTEDYQLLPTGPQAADEDPQKADMGLAEQLEKAEGRQGDNFARYAALGASAVRGSEKKGEESPVLPYIRLGGSFYIPPLNHWQCYSSHMAS